MKTDEIANVVKGQNLSLDAKFRIEGPWASHALEEMRAPIYIQGDVQIGEVVVKIDKGMMFEVNLREGFEHFEQASFEIPMHFLLRRKGQ